MDGIDLIILLFLALAFGVLLCLWSVFGKLTGHERPPRNDGCVADKPSKPEVVESNPESEETSPEAPPREQSASLSPLQRGLRETSLADRSFDHRTKVFAGAPVSKTSCIDNFYDLLDELEKKVGGYRRLEDYSNKTDCPERGVYFFFEPGEMRSTSPSSPRVVHVGANAVRSANTTSTLWDRLKQHRGTLNPRGGNHRGSIFRLLIGDAIGQRNHEPAPTSWGVGSSAPGTTRELERPHEIQVSNYLADMTFLYVSVPDVPGQQDNPRAKLKHNVIALLSGYHELSLDKPSSGWLGHYSTREEVRRSGLWNNEHVRGDCDLAFLDGFEKLIRAM